MATKTDKKNAILQGIIDAAIVYSQNLAGKRFCMFMEMNILKALFR